MQSSTLTNCWRWYIYVNHADDDNDDNDDDDANDDDDDDDVDDDDDDDDDGDDDDGDDGDDYPFFWKAILPNANYLGLRKAEPICRCKTAKLETRRNNKVGKNCNKIHFWVFIESVLNILMRY